MEIDQLKATIAILEGEKRALEATQERGPFDAWQKEQEGKAFIAEVFAGSGFRF